MDIQGLTFDDLDLDEGSLVDGGMLIVKAIEPDGSVSIRFRHANVNWLERLGMIRAIQIVEADQLLTALGDH